MAMSPHPRRAVWAFVAGIALSGAGSAWSGPGTPPVSVVNPQIRLLSPPPRPGKEPVRSVVFDVGAYRGPLVLLVDGADVSSLVRREGNRVVYEPTQPLPPGEHRIQLLPTDPAGPGRAEWTVTTGVAGKAGGGGELYSRSGLSASASQVLGDKVRGSQVAASASLNVDVGARKGLAELEAKGSFAYANTAPADKIEPLTYLLSLTYGPASVAFGDVSFRGTPLVAPGLARRGALAAYSGGGASVQVAQVSSTPVTGWDTGLSAGERIVAVSAGYDLPLGETGPLKISAAYVSGKNPGASGAGVANAEATAGGKAAGLQGSGRVFGTGVNAEAAWSSYDADTSRGAGPQRDKAATVQLDRAIAGVNLSVNYLYAGPDFASVANTGATRDRQQFGLSAGTGFGASTLSATAGRSWDNVERDDSRPVVYNDTWGLTYALAPQAWPTLSLSYLRGQVKSSAEPDETPHTKNTTDTVSGALSYARAGWSATFSSNWSKLDDGQTGQSKTLSEQLSVSLQPWASLSLSPTLAFTRSDRQGTKQDTRLGTLTLSWRPLESVSLDGQGSWTQSSASDGSVDSEQRNAALRLGWAAQWATRLFLARQATLSLSFNYNQQLDHRDSSNGQSSFSGLLGLSVFAPLEGTYGF